MTCDVLNAQMLRDSRLRHGRKSPPKRGQDLRGLCHPPPPHTHTFLHGLTSYHSEGVSKIFSEIKVIYSTSFMQKKQKQKPNVCCKSIGKKAELHLNLVREAGSRKLALHSVYVCW